MKDLAWALKTFRALRTRQNSWRSQNPVAVPAPLSEMLEHLRISRININDSKL